MNTENFDMKGLLNAVQETVDKENADFFKRKEILKNAPEDLDKAINFEKVYIHGVETMLSKNISDPMTYAEAYEWCENEGGRLPTIEELQALYEEGGSVKESFDEKVLWSGTEFYGDVKAFDFKTGKVVIRSKKEKLESNIANIANARAVQTIQIGSMEYDEVKDIYEQ